MNKLMKNLIFGKSAWIAVLLIAGIIFTAAFACESGGDKVPPDSELQSLVKETMNDFTGAIDTGDFNNLYTKASADFQKTYTVAQTKDAFSVFTDKKDLYLPIFKSANSTTPTFSPAPSIRSESGNNILVVAGQFPSTPNAVKFENEYVWRSGGWKMLKLVIKVGS